MIYFIQSGREFVKIGYCARNPQSRLGRLQIGNPVKFRLIGHTDGGKPDEARWHGEFRHLRERGEWFRMDAELRAAIAPFLLPEYVSDRERRNRVALAIAAA